MGNGNLPAVRDDFGLVTQDQLTAMLAMADRIVKSGLAPKGIDSAEKALVVILRGRELGMGVMQSLQDMYVVAGKISMVTGSMASRYLDAGHRYFILEKTAERCSVKFMLHGGQEYVETISFQEAHDAHWDQQWNKDKSTWEPKATWAGRGRATMLLNRTLSSGIRSIAPGVLRGMRSPDEIVGPDEERVAYEPMPPRGPEPEPPPIEEGPQPGAAARPWETMGGAYDDWTISPTKREIFAQFRDKYALSDTGAKALAARAMGRQEPLEYFRDFPGNLERLEAAIIWQLERETVDVPVQATLLETGSEPQ
jgi:hypothetical protein